MHHISVIDDKGFRWTVLVTAVRVFGYGILLPFNHAASVGFFKYA